MAVKEYKQINVKEELTEMGFVKEGLIAFGQSKMGGAWGVIGMAIANATATHYAIVKINDKITIIPYESHKINYDKAVSYPKDDIVKAKVSGDGYFLYRKLKIWTKDGKKHKYFITMGKSEVKKMLELLEIKSK